MTSKEELIARGWKKRSTHDEPRLSELVAAYEEIGLEVHVEVFNPDKEEDCTECMATPTNRYRTIYTREKPEA
jgi:hypothetical protein